MRKVTAIAPANIAFIKYWGRKDEKLRLPANNSLAMNLSNVFTITTVEFLENLKQDQIKMAGEKLDDKSKKRIVDHLERIRNLANIKVHARVVTKNNFPKGTGIASSASGFAALTLAATTAADLKLAKNNFQFLPVKVRALPVVQFLTDLLNGGLEIRVKPHMLTLYTHQIGGTLPILLL